MNKQFSTEGLKRLANDIVGNDISNVNLEILAEVISNLKGSFKHAEIELLHAIVNGRTIKEFAIEIGVTEERALQMQGKNLRRLKHPIYVRKICGIPEPIVIITRETSIQNANLPVITFNTLNRNGLKTFGDVILYRQQKGDFSNLKLGEKHSRELEKLISAL